MAKMKAKGTIDTNALIEESIKERFNKLDGERSTILTRARDCAELTIPSILPPDGHSETDAIATPYQSVGARLVNNLSSKLLLTMLPPNNSFFRVYVTDDAKSKLSEETLQQANDWAVMIEAEGQRVIEKEAIRVSAFELMKSLITTGSALGVKIKEGGLKTYRLDSFVVSRDYKGNPTEIITVEKVDKNTLDDVISSKLTEDSGTSQVTIYTRAVLKLGTWYEYQYVDDVLVDKSLTTYTKETFPYLPLRWTSISGHNYGVGLVEQYLGDFRSLEACFQMLIENAAVAGKTVFGVKAGSILDIKELQDADNGDVIQGDFESDVTVLRVDKGTDIQFLMNVAETLTRRLEQAFLSASSVARDSERTTAREISYMAADLEQSLGGVYSVLSQEFQSPLARLVINSLDNVDFEGYDYNIVTGVDALGRNSDLEKLIQFVSILNNSGLTQAISSRLNIDNLINDITIASSLPTGRYVKSQQQVANEQAQAMQDNALATGATETMKSAGQALGQNLKQQ